MLESVPKLVPKSFGDIKPYFYYIKSARSGPIDNEPRECVLAPVLWELRAESRGPMYPATTPRQIGSAALKQVRRRDRVRDRIAQSSTETFRGSILLRSRQSQI
jgi:hypothetical protein